MAERSCRKQPGPERPKTHTAKYAHACDRVQGYSVTFLRTVVEAKMFWLCFDVKYLNDNHMHANERKIQTNTAVKEVNVQSF